MEGYSLSDVAAATGSDGFGGGTSAWVLIILFALIFGFGGNGFGNNASAATTADIQRAVDLNSIQQGQANLAADVQRTTYETMATVKDSSYNNLSEIRDLQTAIATGFANQQNCCCTTQRAIDQVNYNGAINTAAINANTTAQTQRILDAMNESKISDLQNKVSTLEVQNTINAATAGVVKYPMSSTWSMAGNPFCSCNGNI